MAPLVSAGRHLYLAGENGKMLVLDTRTGDVVRELPTANIPGVIATANGIIVVATWKNGKKMGSVKRYDRRRMDWDISSGTVEAYDDATGKRLWKNDLLGTSLLIADGTILTI
jgi:outer membrane protein assembly factor BamB